MSAFIEDSSPFLSHPLETGILLTHHLLTVSNSVTNLLRDTHFSNKELVYYSALLHDIGKINPYYQYLFYNDEKTREMKKKELLNRFIGQHSLFSAWIASKLLYSTNDLTIKRIHIILCLIAAHHSSLRSSVNTPANDRTGSFKNSKDKIYDYLTRYKKELVAIEEFSLLNWSKCLKEYHRPIHLDGSILKTTEKDAIVPNYMELLLYFSALLQADRGSFSTRKQYHFDINIKTEELIKSNSKLSEIRSKFQNEFISEFNIENNISVIQAPTGIGKTKLFLDIISMYGDKKIFDKVLYFSPLLALTEDFESKINNVIKDADKLDVLVYNHLFSGSLLEKNTKNETPSLFWDFENESFNRKFIITTTQRLLITLYSNSSVDNLKLLSLKNALLIIDEIQIIPKFLLPNFVSILKSLCKFINTKVLLVSATVPEELTSQDIKPIKLRSELESKYHEITLKKIRFHEKIPDITPNLLDYKKQLFMVNTKRKARIIFDKISKLIHSNKILEHQQQLDINQENYPDIYYITTGIRKKTRSKIIGKINNKTKCMVVSTQVIEAGVDISFDLINREVAPLDSLVQVMGRLNREGEATNPVLNVFLFDDGKDHRPYNRLEFEESLKIIKNIFNSQDLYKGLEGYYRTINTLNNSNKKLLSDLEQKMSNYDYPGVWEFINKEIFQNEYGEPVIVPENENDLIKIKEELLFNTKSLKSFYKKYGNLSATLPVPFSLFHNNRHQNGGDYKDLLELFDSELFEKNILLPKSGCLNDIYDDKIGLDKWIKI